MSSFKSGFLGLVGPTNSGKSTLLNYLVGAKVSIVSARPQTTMRTVPRHQLLITSFFGAIAGSGVDDRMTIRFQSRRFGETWQLEGPSFVVRGNHTTVAFFVDSLASTVVDSGCEIRATAVDLGNGPFTLFGGWRGIERVKSP